MKISNLLGFLAIGGVGYYFFKNKKNKSTVSNIVKDNLSVSTPTVSTPPINPPTVNTPTVTTPTVTTPPVNTTSVIDNSSPKIEAGLAPLAVTELTSTGQPLFKPPVNTTWVNPPTSLDTKGTTKTYFGYTVEQSVNVNPDMGLLIRNPSIKSKNNYYIDQFGNLIQAPSRAFPDGVLIETAERIADWRKANGIIV